MKCPSCNSDIAQEKCCHKCGLKIEQQGKIEVTYKEYKISELLEIRHKRPDSLSESKRLASTGKSPFETKKTNVFSDANKNNNKRRRLIWGAVAIVFVITAGAIIFYFLN